MQVAVEFLGKDALSGPANVAGAALTGLEKTAGVLGGALGGLEKGALAVGTAITAMGAAITAAVTIGVMEAGKLQQAVANISSIKPTINTDAVFSSLNLMQTRVAQSAKVMGDALYDVFSSIEVSSRQGLVLVEKFAKGAIASITDAKTFGTAIMGELNAFKLGVAETDHLMDIFFNTVKIGVVTGQELAQNLGLVTQSAKMAGVSVEELGGLIAGVTKEGGPAAQSINNLNNLLLKLNTKESAAAFKELGIQTVDSSGKLRGVIPVLTDLRDHLDTYTEAGRLAAMQRIFPDLQARAGAAVVMGELDTVNRAIEENVSKTGAAGEAYEKMAGTFQTQTTLLRQTFDSILTSVGSGVLPVLTSVTSSVQKFAAETAPLWDGWQQRLKDAFKVGGFSAWLTEVGSVAGELGKQIEKWVPAFSGWVDNGKTELGNALTKVYTETVVPWVTDKAQDLKTKFETEWVPALVDWWNSAETQGKVKGAMNAMGDKAQEWATKGGEGWTKFEAIGASLGNALANSVKDAITTQSMEWFNGLPQGVQDILRGKFGVFPQETPPIAPFTAPTPGAPVGTPGTGGFAAFPVQGYTGTVGAHWGVQGATGGTDLFANRGTPVVAANAGQVIEAGYSSVGGNYVLVAGPNGMQYYYAHLDQAPLVNKGQQVTGGQQLGVVGDSGNAAGKGTHLHFGAGFGIQNGSGAQGGLGQNFDAVAALNATLAGAVASPGATDLHAVARALALEYGLNPDIFEAQIQAEHGFKTDTNPNSAGARGIGQLMPGTANSLAQQLGLTQQQLWSDPQNQLRAAALYDQQNLATFGGDYSLALAAYNTGPGNVAAGKIPDVTQKYVTDILAAARKGRNPGQTLSVPGLTPEQMAALTGGAPGDEDVPEATPAAKEPGTINPYALTQEKLDAAFGGAEAEAAAGTRGRAILKAFGDAVEGEKPHALETLAGTMADLKLALLNDPQLSPEEALARYGEVMASVNTALLDGGEEAVATARTKITELEQTLSLDKIQAAAEKKQAEINRKADQAEKDALAQTARAVASMTTSREAAIADRDAEQAESERIAKAVEGAKLYVKAQEDQLSAIIDLQKQERSFQQERAALDLKYLEDLALIQNKKRGTDMSGVMASTAHTDPQAALNQELRDKVAAHNVDVFNLNQQQQIKAANHKQDVDWKLEETALASTLKATILDPTAETAKTTMNNWKDAYDYTVRIPREAALKWTETEATIGRIKTEQSNALGQLAIDTDLAKTRITSLTEPTGLPAVKTAADETFSQAVKDTDQILQNIIAINAAQGNAAGVTTGTASGTNNGSTGGGDPKNPTPGGPGQPPKDDDFIGAALLGFGSEAFGGVGSYNEPPVRAGVRVTGIDRTGGGTLNRLTDAMRDAMANGMIQAADAAAAANPRVNAITKILDPMAFNTLQQLDLKPPPAAEPWPVYVMNPAMGLGASGMLSGLGAYGSGLVPTGGGFGGLGGSGMSSGLPGGYHPAVYLPSGGSGEGYGSGGGAAPIDYDRLAAAMSRLTVQVDRQTLGRVVRTDQRQYSQSNLSNGVGGI